MASTQDTLVVEEIVNWTAARSQRELHMKHLRADMYALSQNLQTHLIYTSKEVEYAGGPLGEALTIQEPVERED